MVIGKLSDSNQILGKVKKMVDLVQKGPNSVQNPNKKVNHPPFFRTPPPKWTAGSLFYTFFILKPSLINYTKGVELTASTEGI